MYRVGCQEATLQGALPLVFTYLYRRKFVLVVFWDIRSFQNTRLIRKFLLHGIYDLRKFGCEGLNLIQHRSYGVIDIGCLARVRNRKVFDLSVFDALFHLFGKFPRLGHLFCLSKQSLTHFQ